MKRNFGIFLFVVVAIMSIYAKCNKVDINQCAGNCYNITGVVKDSLSGTPIPNADVEIATISRANSYAGTYGNGLTNNSGVYNLFYPSKEIDFENYNLLVLIKAPSEYIADDYRDLKSLAYKIFKSDSPKIGVPIIINASLLKKAFLNLRIVKTASNNSLNSFYYRFGKIAYKDINVFPSSNNVDTTYHFETAADIKSYLMWETKNGAIINKFSDSLIIQAGQTRDYVIRL